jgi:hypothetical protein
MKWQMTYVLMQILDGQFWPIKITFLRIYKFCYDLDFSSYNNMSQLYVMGWIIESNVTQLNFASDHLETVTGAIHRNSPFRRMASKAGVEGGIHVIRFHAKMASRDGPISVVYFIANILESYE